MYPANIKGRAKLAKKLFFESPYANIAILHLLRKWWLLFVHWFKTLWLFLIIKHDISVIFQVPSWLLPPSSRSKREFYVFDINFFKLIDANWGKKSGKNDANQGWKLLKWCEFGLILAKNFIEIIQIGPNFEKVDKLMHSKIDHLTLSDLSPG